ncbi:MAG: hypothetical protein Q9227_001103 [Pyrenula ochraceoflavens]
MLIMFRLRNDRATICIRHRPYEHNADYTVVIAEEFPRAVAKTFSRHINSLFPSLLSTPANKLTAIPTSVLLIGGTTEGHKQVFQWMLRCCEGRGIIEFPYSSYEAFWSYACALNAAYILQIQYLCDNLMDRLQKVSGKQVHSEDIRKVYQVLPGKEHDGNLVKVLVVNSIADAIFEKRLQARKLIEEVRQEIPEFDEAVERRIERLKDKARAAEEQKRGKKSNKSHSNRKAQLQADKQEKGDVSQKFLQKQAQETREEATSNDGSIISTEGKEGSTNTSVSSERPRSSRYEQHKEPVLDESVADVNNPPALPLRTLPKPETHQQSSETKTKEPRVVRKGKHGKAGWAKFDLQ